MKVGVVFPQTEIGSDVGAVRAFGEGVAELGFHHIVAYDHVLGADTTVHQDWSGPYDLHSAFHEPLVLFGFLSAITSLELVTGILVAPQRQTALIAKQAAQVDLLCKGRFRLGIGIGWNSVEYEALGKSFSDRGRRVEEQVTLLRRLWTEESVTFQGTYEHVTAAGLCPLPERSIPIWFGATTEPALRRAGRLGDGWFPQVGPGEGLEEIKRIVDDAAVAVGRDPRSIGMEGWLPVDSPDPDTVATKMGLWREAGATHVSVDTAEQGLRGADAHLSALASVAGAALAAGDAPG